ncbi:MAG: coproporphyrinogen dehydrogenase HemZ [Oscillospiraceae bacterium]|jgi:oxygen-independent coproporphyrinogen-3 oxidase|nr:coproporphyrinogen dehydrogenase HemZ [Oscillospiraceae bacterium]
MKLRLEGHDYKYAVEQILLALFPNERPEYGGEEKTPQSQLSVKSTLRIGEQLAAATALITDGEGKRFRGEARIPVEKFTQNAALTTEKSREVARSRELQKIVKLAFYRAAVKMTGTTPDWGALTGIRPSTLLSRMLETHSERAAVAKFRSEYFVSRERAELCLDAARAELKVRKSLAPQDVAVYIGIPFCPTRCAYCSFVSQSVEKTAKLIPPYLDALQREIEATGRVIAGLGLRVTSLYIGGGTPTTLDARQLAELLDTLNARLDLSHLLEYTVEAGRPDTITREKLQIMREHGATRVSVNPQSMEQRVLDAIGRRHTPEDVLNAIDDARDAGFKCINADLIAGLPADDVHGFKSTLDVIKSLNLPNVTVHTLALKKGSTLKLEGAARLPTGDEVRAMLDYANTTLRRNGFKPYYLYRQKYMSGGFENVGWSQAGYEGLYNIVMMDELCSVFALGGGGVTKIVTPDGRLMRIFNPKYPYEYVSGIEQIIAKKLSILPDSANYEY